MVQSLGNLVRAKRPIRLPNVLTRDEVKLLLSFLEPDLQLIGLIRQDMWNGLSTRSDEGSAGCWGNYRVLRAVYAGTGGGTGGGELASYLNYAVQVKLS